MIDQNKTQAQRALTCTYTLGVDEAGYGAIAGALVVAGVAYPRGAVPPSVESGASRRRTLHIRDSKRLRATHLQQLQALIQQTCAYHDVVVFSATEVDRYGGPYEAKQRGIRQIIETAWDFLAGNDASVTINVVVDGDLSPELCDLCAGGVLGIAKADETVWQVSAASILAKARQLQELQALHDAHPAYGFLSCKGYPTPKHLEALKRHGPCASHRVSTRAVSRLYPPTRGREQ